MNEGISGLLTSYAVNDPHAHSSACKWPGSSAPWIGFPVGYAAPGVRLTVFGYVAMVMSQ